MKAQLKKADKKPSEHYIIGKNGVTEVKSKALKKKKEIPKHYRGNTNSEGGIPFGKKPR